MKILVPLDSSEFSLKALERAIDIAKKEGGDLVLMSVALDFRDVEEIPLRYVDRLKQQAMRAVDVGKEIVEKAGLKPEIRVETGVSPADNIVKCAEEINAGLIVIGHRGIAGFGRFLVGSVAARVVAYAPCSVLVVR
jgi:nucleotide-binding universal stress UspA family protein